MTDYIVRTYENETELQKHLNQWKHQFDITIEALSTTYNNGNILITVIIKRSRRD